VQDGTIWRTRTWVAIAVPPRSLDKDDFGYVLIVDAKSQQALRHSEGGDWVLGGEDVPAGHPYYKMGQPSGCEGCAAKEVTYSTHTPQAEIVRLTSYDFSCFTRLISCKFPEDLMPAAREESPTILTPTIKRLPIHQRWRIPAGVSCGPWREMQER